MQIEPGTKIWLEFGGTKVLLPVNPSEIDDATSVPQDTFKILESGQVGIPQYPDLKSFKFKSFFPGNIEPFVSEEALDPVTYCDILNAAMNEAEIGRIIINRKNGWNVNIASPEAMDVNGDGKVNSLDGLILMRYLNGWNVTLG